MTLFFIVQMNNQKKKKKKNPAKKLQSVSCSGLVAVRDQLYISVCYSLCPSGYIVDDEVDIYESSSKIVQL